MAISPYVIILMLSYVTVKASVTITLDNQTPLVLSCSPSSLDITKVQELFCGGQSEDTSTDIDTHSGDTNKAVTPGNSDNKGGNSVGMQDESRVTPTDAEFWKNGTIIIGTLLGGHILLDVVVICLVIFLYRNDCIFKKTKRPKKLDTSDDIHSQCPDLISSASLSSSGVRSGTLSSRQSLHHSEMSQSLQGIPTQTSSARRSQTFPRNPSRGTQRSVIDKLKKSHNKETSPKVQYSTKQPMTRLESMFKAELLQPQHKTQSHDIKQNIDNYMTEPKEKPQPVPEETEIINQSATANVAVLKYRMQMNKESITNNEDMDSIEKKTPALTKLETQGISFTLNQTGVLGETEIMKPTYSGQSKDCHQSSPSHAVSNSNRQKIIKSVDSNMSSGRSMSSDSSDTVSLASRSISDLSKDVTVLNDENKCGKRGKNQILASGMQHPKYIPYDSSDTSSTSSSTGPSVDKNMEPVNNNERQDEVSVDITSSQEERPMPVSERVKLLYEKS